MYSKLSRMLITKSRFSLIHRMAISHVPLKVPSTPLTPKASTIFGVKRKGTRYPLKVKKSEYFWNLQNRAFFEDTVEIDMRNCPVALHENVIVMTVT